MAFLVAFGTDLFFRMRWWQIYCLGFCPFLEFNFFLISKLLAGRILGFSFTTSDFSWGSRHMGAQVHQGNAAPNPSFKRDA